MREFYTEFSGDKGETIVSPLTVLSYLDEILILMQFAENAYNDEENQFDHLI